MTNLNSSIESAVEEIVTTEVSDMVRDGIITPEQATAKFMLSFVRCVRAKTDWPQLNKRPGS